MRYEILYDQAFPIVKAYLEQGEGLKAESDAMIAMSPTVDVTGGVDGGIIKGIARKFSGESFFMQYLKANRGPGEVLLAHAIPGAIVPVQLDGSYGLRVQKNGYLASSDGIDISTAAQNVLKGLFSKEGFFVVKISGRGLVFISSYGAIHPITLDQGQEIVIDNGHLVAWPDYMSYKMEKASSKGWISSFTSGEGLVCRFTGPGTIFIQTRNPGAFKSWIGSMSK
ncbi:MAG: TIGR00266 family protein [Deltaproteobacteria bacterium]|jgi:uncharacterized protein (TIGR00266 family)|nr:TIGR00266 family protein [Deltaproteobacteria bacterium]